MTTDKNLERRGLMLVMSSPSGAGKSTISRALMDRDDKLTMSVSATTRERRPSEEHGKHYFFIDKTAFDRMVDLGEMLEHARVFENYYGTPKEPVEAALAAGRDVMFDVDWQGAQQLADNAGNDLVRVFILPPSMEELERRLFNRAQDSEDEVHKRMAEAASEMSHYREYDYIIVNRDIEESIASVEKILAAERLKLDRQIGVHDFIAEMCGDKK